MSSQKRKQHKFVENNPVATALLMSILWFVLYQVVELAINIPLSIVISGYDGMSGPIGLILSVVIMMGVYKWWFKPEFEGMLKGNLPLGFLLGLIELGYVVLSFVLSVLTGYELSFKTLTLKILFTSLTAGLAEELVFRGVLISTLMRQWKDRNKFWTAALVSGIFFGLIHASNVFSGANPLRTILQVIEAAGIGVIFSAIYLRCGSTLPCMFFHTVHDILAIAGSSGVDENGIITGSTVSWTDGVNLVLTFAVAAIGFWLLRGAKNEEMKALWNSKWKAAEIETE